jgi:hypothetical protein
MQNTHHTDMHCFIEGSIVVARDDPYKTERTVIAIGGYYKDDHIQLDNKKSQWEFARDFKKV